MKERRSITRWQIQRPAKVKLEGALEYAPCLINDINFKGMRMTFKLHLSLDKFQKMLIMCSEDFCLWVEAWGVWHKKTAEQNTYGFYFSKIMDSDKERLFQFIRTNYQHNVKERWRGSIETKEGDGMHNGMSEDKRTFERFTTNLTLRYLNVDSNKEGEAVTYDISAKGLGLMSGQPFLPHTPLELWIKVPDQGQPLYTRGAVSWSEKISPDQYRTGIMLDKADFMGMSRILRAQAQ